MKKIEIRVQGVERSVPIEQLKAFQGELKSISDQNMSRLKTQIIRLGVIAPVFVWETKTAKHIIDGHQRIKALMELKEEGFEVPKEIPVVSLPAKNKKEAKEMLLSMSSNYADINMEGLHNFMIGLDPDTLEGIRLIEGHQIMLGGNIDLGDFFEKKPEDESEQTAKPVICPHCGKDINAPVIEENEPEL